MLVADLYKAHQLVVNDEAEPAYSADCKDEMRPKHIMRLSRYIRKTETVQALG